MKAIIAGLTDNRIEFFAANGEIKMLQNGIVLNFDEIDVEILGEVRQQLDNDERAMQALTDLGITNPIEQLQKYILCNYSKLDGTSDVGNGSQKEYCNCQFRGSCPVEGKLCAKLKADNGILSKQEIKIIELFASDKSEKEIANILFVSENTVKVHRANIEHKIGCKSHKGIVTFYHERIA